MVRSRPATLDRGLKYPQLWSAGWLQCKFSAGRSVDAIAAEVGCSPYAVRYAANRLGVERRHAPRRPELRDEALLRRLYLDEQLSISQIATRLGATHNPVSEALARAGIRTRQSRPDPRLTDTQWLRQLYVDDRLSARKIADRVGVHQNTVFAALKRAGIPRRKPVRRRSEKRARVPKRRAVPELADVDWPTARRRDGWTATQIAATLDVSRGRVSRALHAVGLQTRKREAPELADVTWLTTRRDERWSVARIAAHLHVAPTRVYEAFREAGIPTRLPPKARPVQLDDVGWLTARRAEGWTDQDIANHLDVGRAQVRDALRQTGLIKVFEVGSSRAKLATRPPSHSG